MIQLQVALDGDLPSAIHILSQIHPYTHILEIGTPLIYREGMRAVQEIRELYPDKTLLADLKIMDAGEEEATIAFEAGANIVTVLGVSNDLTIQGAIRSAHQHKAKIMVDMMQVSNIVERGKQLVEMGCELLCVHTAYDLQSTHESPYHELERLKHQLPRVQLAIAGGVNFAILDDILPHQPAIIIVGGAITRASDPTSSAQQIYEWIQSYATD